MVQETYRPIDAIRLVLMVMKSIDQLSKEPAISAKMIAEKAMQDTYGVNPPYAKDGVFAHLFLFARLFMAEKFDIGDEETMRDPLPGEDAMSHGARLRAKKQELDKHIKALSERIGP